MLAEEKSSLTAIIKNNSLFKKTIQKLTIGDDLSFKEKSFILSCALQFLRLYNNDRRFKGYAELSYYIILKYSITYSDYKPLYDYATSFGFYPITNALLENKIIENQNISDFFTQIQLKNFRKNFDSHKSYVETYEQNITGDSLIKDTSTEKGFVAPTSFGKSSIIIEYIKALKTKQKIAIIVPTKSLLAQTYKLVRDAKLQYKILIHDEMYNGEQSFIAVFTQERALRLMSKKDIIYDTLIIDEAHNLLNSDSRSILIARLLRLNLKHNPNQKTLYLSPLLNDLNNLRVSRNQTVAAHKIFFNIKVPEIFEYKINNTVLAHNKFFINNQNSGYEIGTYNNYFQYLQTVSGEKNFLYNYRPIHIERLAKDLARTLPPIKQTEEILQLIQILKSEVHEKFFCIDLLKKGVIYLHGKIPDLIKEYLEKKFNDIAEIKYVIANSVILEGINLPIDKLFVFNTYGLNGKELTNLIGRVNRLNEIFTKETNNLSKLLPEVHFINNTLYNRTEKDNMFNKIQLLRSRVFKDEISNPILESFDYDSMKDNTETLQKKKDRVKTIIDEEGFLLSDQQSDKSKLKQYLIESGINIFYKEIDTLTEQLLKKMNSRITRTSVWKTATIMDRIFILFIEDFQQREYFFLDFEFYRLKDPIARRYYEIIIQNRRKSLKENISIIYRYLSRRRDSKNRKDHIYYIGTAYGEQKYSSETYFNTLKNSDVAIDLREKNDQQLVNYAIVKLKIEEDFISYKVNKFIVFMHDYKLISDNEYNMYIYGTIDEKKISLTKFGLNIGLIARLQKDNQLSNLELDEYNNLTSNNDFKRYLDSLNDFQRFEIEKFIS